jgi:hypothetical protein
MPLTYESTKRPIYGSTNGTAFNGRHVKRQNRKVGIFTARYGAADVRVAAANSVNGTSKASSRILKVGWKAVFLGFGLPTDEHGPPFSPISTIQYATCAER